jgi:hypothetical protein
VPPKRAAHDGKEHDLVVATAVTVLMSLLVGWLAGMLTHKRAERWCPVDGSKLKCFHCAKAGLHILEDRG